MDEGKEMCTLPGCLLELHGTKWCFTHYMRNRRNYHPLLVRRRDPDTIEPFEVIPIEYLKQGEKVIRLYAKQFANTPQALGIPAK